MKYKTLSYTLPKAVAILIIVLMISPPMTAHGQSPIANIYNVISSLESNGIRYTFTLDIDNLKGETVRVGLWLRDTNDNLISHAGSNSDYKDPSGYVTAQKNATPRYDGSRWSNFSLYIPFSELPTGSYRIYPQILVQYGGGNIKSYDQSTGAPSFSLNIGGSSGDTRSNETTGSTTNPNVQNSDGDSITDDMELSIARAFMPVYEYDEEEHNIVEITQGITTHKDVAYLYQVSAVSCYARINSDSFEPVITSRYGNRESYLFTVVALYTYDYVPHDPLYYKESDTFAHFGDSEPVRICLNSPDLTTSSVEFIQIRRHGHTYNYLPHELEWSRGTHPYLYVSEGKHGTFISDLECNDAVSGIQYLGWREDCSGGQIIRPAVWSNLNVGENQGNRVTASDLGNSDLARMFPTEIIWSPEMHNSSSRDHYFCGGYAPACPSCKHEVVAPRLYMERWCGTTMGTKWWPEIYPLH